MTDAPDRRVGRYAAAALLCAAVLAIPALFGSFAQYFALNVLLLVLLALSFNLLFGMTGLLSFGHAAFYAAGAYATALLLRAGAPLLPAVLAGALVAAALAAVVGAFCVRHTRVYFSMLTLAFGMFVYAIVWKWTDVTGGDDGLVGIPRKSLGLPGPLDVDLSPLRKYYWFAAILVIFLAFVVAGGFAGLSGALLAPLEQTVAPTAAHWTKSAEPVMAALIGGPFSFAGPIVGAVVYLGLKELIVRFTEYWLLVFGLVLLGVVLAFRGGLLGAAEALLARRPWMSAPRTGAAPRKDAA